MSLKVTVDPDICQGNAVCIKWSPDVFALDEVEVAQVLLDTVPDERREELLRTATSCPTQAIAISEIP